MNNFHKKFSTSILKKKDFYHIKINNNFLKTPHGNTFFVPSKNIAKAVLSELNMGTENSSVVSFTKITNSAIDIINNDKKKFVKNLAINIHNDAICYFSDEPKDLGGISESDMAALEQTQRTQSIESVGTVITEEAERAEKILPDTLDTVWKASTKHSESSADPFYLRFLAEGLDSGQISAHRPETVPTSLDDAVDEMWMNLPGDRDFLLHRLLCTLAVMFDYADDELFAELFSRDIPEGAEPLRPDDIAQLRSQAGKLLVYDGERYNLFHDRFRSFLVGANS